MPNVLSIYISYDKGFSEISGGLQDWRLIRSFASVYDQHLWTMCALWGMGEYLHGLLKISDQWRPGAGSGLQDGDDDEYWRDLGYDIWSGCNSADMLEICIWKKGGVGHDILYLLQNMRFELYRTVRAVISICDSVNYITEPDELRHRACSLGKIIIWTRMGFLFLI